MSRRNWKRIQPSSLVDALHLCKDYALEKKRYKVERIAQLMGVSLDLLYKWLANGRMPAKFILLYEYICGINLVTRWFAASTGKLMIEVPTGRNATATDLHDLQEVLNATVGGLIKFYKGSAKAEDVLSLIQQGMGSLAWHKGNVEKHLQPEFEFTQEE